MTQSEKVKADRILVVDDEPVILQLLNDVLTDEGYEVDGADNANAAFEYIDKKTYSLILLDVKLPGISGIEFYEKLQATSSPVARKVVFLTGDVIGHNTRDFLKRTKAPYFAKPIDINIVISDIAKLLAAPGGNHPPG